MTIEQIEKAVERGQPFTLTTADGAIFEVPHPDFISLPPKMAKRRPYVFVYSMDGTSSCLSLLTITTLRYKDEAEVS